MQRIKVQRRQAIRTLYPNELKHVTGGEGSAGTGGNCNGTNSGGGDG